MSADHSITITIRLARIPDFSNYRASDNGSIWIVRRYRGKHWNRMKPFPDYYPRIRIRRDSTGKLEWRNVHTVIMEAFVGPRPDGMLCRHLDGNPLNSRLSNLKWGTHEENEADKKIHGTTARGSRQGNSKLVESDIPIVRSLHAGGMGQSEIGRMFGIRQATVSKIILRRSWGHIP